MNDTQAIAAEIATLPRGEVISHGCARTIASRWHDGQGSALCALATSGAIEVIRVRRELDDTVRMVERGEAGSTFDAAERAELDALSDYVKVHGHRGSVGGWSLLWVR
jgi:hypothetical protein